MIFVFDREKSKLNKEKHGIDFVEAQAMWADPHLVRIPSNYLDEDRYIMIGRIEEKIWSAITTYRTNEIRIISGRRSRNKEIEIYESK